ncbi:hypothetical protein HDE_09859 [Halotydeus destructor]|nr:hypothetical protein HDE_09859 [Halotydeus destructor]
MKLCSLVVVIFLVYPCHSWPDFKAMAKKGFYSYYPDYKQQPLESGGLDFPFPLQALQDGGGDFMQPQDSAVRGVVNYDHVHEEMMRMADSMRFIFVPVDREQQVYGGNYFDYRHETVSNYLPDQLLQSKDYQQRHPR